MYMRLAENPERRHPEREMMYWHGVHTVSEYWQRNGLGTRATHCMWHETC